MKVGTFLLTLFIMMPVVTVFAMDRTTLIYGESTGSDHEEILYVLESKGGLIHISADFKDEYHTIVTDKNLNTTKLEISFPENPTVISICRENDRLMIEREQPRSIHLDPEIPWYQFLISLKSFTMSGEKKKSFYALSANFDERLSKGKGIQLLRFVAKRDGKDALDINGKEVEAIRVVVTFDDIRSLFWKAHYWYRRSDGLLLMYKEVRGGPGTPETTGTLIKEENMYE